MEYEPKPLQQEEVEKLQQQLEASKSSIPLTEAELEALDEPDENDHLYGRK